MIYLDLVYKHGVFPGRELLNYHRVKKNGMGMYEQIHVVS